MPIKILHVVLSMETGGLENGIVNITNLIDPEHFDMDILCLRARGELADRITRPNAKVIFNEDSGHGIITAAKNVYRACRQHNYDIVHAHGFTTMLASWLGGRLARAPVVINGEHGVLYDDTWRRRMLQRFLFNSMDLNLSVSAVLVDDIVKRFGAHADNFKAVINGVDTEKFKPDLEARAAIRQQFGFTDENFIVGSVGRLVEVKNYPSLIKGFTQLHQTFPQARLIFVGDGDQRQVLEQCARDNGVLDQVYFPGRRNDVAALINAMDVFVLSSFSEGLSNTVLEAMSCGKPVVVTKVGGNPEIVVEDYCGHMYPSDDTEALCSYLRQFAESPEKVSAFSQNSRQHILDNLSIGAMIRGYEAVYTELARQHA